MSPLFSRFLLSVLFIASALITTPSLYAQQLDENGRLNGKKVTAAKEPCEWVDGDDEDKDSLGDICQVKVGKTCSKEGFECTKHEGQKTINCLCKGGGIYIEGVTCDDPVLAGN